MLIVGDEMGVRLGGSGGIKNIAFFKRHNL